MGGMAGSFLLLSLSPSAVGLTLALVVWGLAASVYHPSALSLISRGVEHRGSAFAYYGMAGNLSTSLAPFVTAVLLLLVGWRLAVAFLGAVGIATTLAASRTTFNERAATEKMAAEGDDVGGGRTETGTHKRMPPETFEGLFHASRTLFASSFFLVFFAVLLSGMYYRGIITFLRGFLTIPGVSALGVTGLELDSSRYLYASLLIIGVIGQYISGKLTGRIAPEYGLIGAYGVLTLLALAFVPAAESAVLLVGVSGALGFVLFGIQPLHQSLVAKHSSTDVHGLSYGYTYLEIFDIDGLGTAIAGGVLTYSSVCKSSLTRPHAVVRSAVQSVANATISLREWAVLRPCGYLRGLCRRYCPPRRTPSWKPRRPQEDERAALNGYLTRRVHPRSYLSRCSLLGQTRA
jgi:hypothetical protein